jgi:hypothetical protein
MYVYVYVCMHVYVYVYVCMHVYVYVYVCMHVYVYVYVCMCVCRCVCMHVYMYVFKPFCSVIHKCILQPPQHITYDSRRCIACASPPRQPQHHGTQVRVKTEYVHALIVCL